MKRVLGISALLLVVLLTSCDSIFNRHLIKDSSKRKEIHEQFLDRVKLVESYDSTILTIINSELTTKEREAFEFLYAYMPLSDLAMHSPEYVLKNARLALKTQKEFRWARKAPADIFLHFVLPYRVNNEYTDNAREVFFEELRDRLKGMDAYQAALEVNYWCHEKVTYQSTDERTCGPLTAVKSAFGRCGEESTFAVAAYRSVGIPARQVYTPRWAHTDDNHAWVEVYVDGKWHFLGACEPEPELDRGWFAGPAKRAMMTRTFVFGKYNGPEEKLNQTRFFTEINLMPNYAPIRQLEVTVLDKPGNPVADANVEFQLYNYAEFYPIAKLKTNSKGKCKVTTGVGDLMIWVSKNGKYTFEKADRAQNTITLTLSDKVPSTNRTLRLVPPDEQPIANVDSKKSEEHDKRIKHGNDLRNRYIKTFNDSSSAANLAMEKGISISETWSYLSKSRGNWNEIYSFIKNLDAKDVTVGMAMLATLREKDFRDVTAKVLADHLACVDSFPALLDNKDLDDFDKYVLSPRIGREFITPWRSFLQSVFSFEEIGFFRNNPQNIAKWLNEFITLDTESNYYGVPLSPESVYQIRHADAYSLSIFFVAACRSFGIPARLEPASKKPQFLMNGKWIYADVKGINAEETTQPLTGKLTISLDPNSAVDNPKYYKHFTIARFENGKYNTLDFEYSDKFNQFPASLELPEGLYRIIAANRDKSGAVSCKIYHVEVESDGEQNISIEFPSTNVELRNNLTISTDVTLPLVGGEKSIEQLTGSSPAIIAIIDPLSEPTRHFLNDLSQLSKELEAIPVAIVCAKEKAILELSLENVFGGKDYPQNTLLGVDSSGKFEESVIQSLGEDAVYPIVIVVSHDGSILYNSSGYSINQGDKILSILKQ